MQNEKPKQRTNIDFSKHQLTIKESDFCIVHVFKKPDTVDCMVKFINCEGVMSVTGDLGNWIFCRRFIPSAESDYVSDGYWIEKLRNSSEQSAGNYSPELTEQEIKEMLSEEDCYSEETIEFLKEALEHTDSEYEYKAFLYNNNVMDEPPYCKDVHFWLLGVFDAYDEIVYRLKTQSNEKTTIQDN